LTNLPQHVAIIMDGNRRWAERHGLPRSEGHRAGVKSLRNVVKCLGEHHIPYLTVYSFSTENWNRSQDEVEELFSLMEEVLRTEVEELHKNGIRIKHIGSVEKIPSDLLDGIERAAELTKNNRNMTVNFALNYGGRSEIIKAVKEIVSDGISPSLVDENLFSKYLYTYGIPDVDLVIRTGGETRLSNFLTWQTVYSEIYFTDVLWPDFDGAEVEKALIFYNNKQRRFGR